MDYATIRFSWANPELEAVNIWEHYVKSFGGHLWRNWWVIYCDFKIIRSEFDNAYDTPSILQFAIEDDRQWTSHIDYKYGNSPEDFDKVVTILFDWKERVAIIRRSWE